MSSCSHYRESLELWATRFALTIYFISPWSFVRLVSYGNIYSRQDLFIFHYPFHQFIAFSPSSMTVHYESVYVLVSCRNWVVLRGRVKLSVSVHERCTVRLLCFCSIGDEGLSIKYITVIKHQIWWQDSEKPRTKKKKGPQLLQKDTGENIFCSCRWSQR